MAEPSTSTAQTCLACTVCLETLKDPVTLPCGHHFCMGCIKSCWDRDNPDCVYKCPQCRKDFPKRPILHRNTVLAAAVDKLRSGMKRPYPSESTAGPGDVLCDVCTGSQVRAVKSCLVCLASYCQTHLQPHCEAPAFKRHRLVEATGQLQDKICPDHQKLREVYCRTDQTCVCLLCSETRHRGHDTVSTEREWTEKQRQLQEIRTQTQRKIQEREKELQELRQAGESFKRSAQKSLLETDRILKNMILSFEKMRSKIKEQFELKKTAVEKKGVSLTKRLEQEIAELRRRDAELSQLSHTEDHIHFLQNFQSVCVLPGAGDSPSITVDSNFSFEAVRRAVSGLKERLEDIWNGESIKIMQKVKDISIVQAAEPRTRAEFLQYACRLTLDPNTAHRHLRLSEGNRRATWNEKTQPYPNHPGRFDCYYQVLCREGLSDRRCYWEVEYTGKVDIGVTYKGISRKGEGDGCILGYNDKSWRLNCSESGYAVWHCKNETPVTARHSNRIGVYVDHEAGTLSFYSVSDQMILLHRFQTSFTEPLYPGFWVRWSGCGVKLLSSVTQEG